MGAAMQVRYTCLGHNVRVQRWGRSRAGSKVRTAALPSTRTAVVIDRDTPAGEMRLAEIPMPVVESNQLLIEVHAAGVNALDWFISNAVRGTPPFVRIWPFIPGKDVSGVVVGVGDDVKDWREGDEVFGMTGFSLPGGVTDFTPKKFASGAYTTYTTLDTAIAARKPQNISHIDAAGLPLAALTAWIALVDTARLSAGSKVLILGGAGGVGTLAIQLAKAHCKCETVAVTASQASSSLVTSLGADVVIDYQKDDFADILAGADYDCVVDAVGYDDKCGRAARVLNEDSGMLVDLTGPPSVGHLRRGQSMNSLGEYFSMLAKDGDRVRYKLVGIQQNGPALRKMASYMEDGSMKPVTDKVFQGLSELQDAFDYNKAGKAHGKVAIDLKS